MYLAEMQHSSPHSATTGIRLWESIQSWQARVMEQDWSPPLLPEADILGKGSHALCSCPPAYVGLWYWVDSFAFSALLPSQRPCSPGVETPKGCRQGGEWDEQIRESWLWSQMSPTQLCPGSIHAAESPFFAGQLLAFFWKVIPGSQQSKVPLLMRNQRPGLHPSARTFPYRPMRGVSASLA